MIRADGGRSPGPAAKGVIGIDQKKETPQDRYNKAHTVNVNIRLMKNTEQDIIAKLESVPNKSGYIKRLIRQDITAGS